MAPNALVQVQPEGPNEVSSWNEGVAVVERMSPATNCSGTCATET